MKAPLGGVYMMPCTPEELAAQYSDLIVALQDDAPHACADFLDVAAKISQKHGKEPFYVLAMMIAAIFDRVDQLGGASLVGPTLMFKQHMASVEDADETTPESEPN